MYEKILTFIGLLGFVGMVWFNWQFTVCFFAYNTWLWHTQEVRWFGASSNLASKLKAYGDNFTKNEA